MSEFLDTSELDLIRQDFVDLVQSPEAMSVTLRWYTYTDPHDPVYNDHGDDAGTAENESVKAYFVPIEPKFLEKDFGGVMPGDAIFLFDKDLDIAGRERVVFETPEGARYVPLVKPPQVFYHYTALTLGGETPVQQVYARLES